MPVLPPLVVAHSRNGSTVLKSSQYINSKSKCSKEESEWVILISSQESIHIVIGEVVVKI